MWTATANAKNYIEKLYNHYADLFDLAVPTNITPIVTPHPPEEPSSSKRPAHSRFPSSFMIYLVGTVLMRELTHQLIGKS